MSRLNINSTSSPNIRELHHGRAVVLMPEEETFTTQAPVGVKTVGFYSGMPENLPMPSANTH
jgi:hypothetical protein